MTSEILSRLEAHYRLIKKRSIGDLFDDPDRFKNFSREAGDIFLDFSKTSIDNKAKSLLVGLIDGSSLNLKRKDMFSGARINKSEKRSVLHWALRDTNNTIPLNDEVLSDSIRQVRHDIEIFAESIRSGRIKSVSGSNFTDIVNIGIGGSDLGPKMTTRALAPYHDGPRCHFIANVDGADMTDTLRHLEPETTLVIIASKTFKTIETMTNARSVIKWLKNKMPIGFERNLVAVSSNLKEVTAYGISSDRIFGFPDAIGGRYSIWGPIGLPLMIAVGVKNFRDFLSGAHDMDSHFLTASLDTNLPVLLAMIGVWHRNICGYTTRAILPYEQRLSILPAYLQQLDMESNGKRVGEIGNYLDQDTVPIVWGESGTNGQHAFFQMLHQGTSIVPCEFIVGSKGHEPDLQHHHDLLIANCLAQSEALMNGKFFNGEDSLKSYHEFPGNRPSVTIAYPKLTPKVLGSLISLFEHRTFVEGIVWGVNSFDQWGVELGKELSSEFLPLVQKRSNYKPKNQSTAGLIAKLTAH